MKRYRKNKLALKLQSIEAKLIIDGVVDRLRFMKIPCLTVHDSIVCKISNVERVFKVLDQELERLIGHKCKIKRKHRLKEAGDSIGVEANKVRRLKKDGKLKRLKIRHVKPTSEELERFLADGICG